MNVKLKSALNSKNNQTHDPTSRDEVPTFHVQTGVQAGGFFQRWQDWWDGVSAGFNAADRSTGLGG